MEIPKFRYSAITIFTGQHPRHLSLIQRLASIADTVYVVHEVSGSLIPSKDRSEVMRQYFKGVASAERKYFGEVQFTLPNVRTISILSGDASGLELSVYGDALSAEAFVVFGASFLKGPIGQFLEDHRAINCHVGMSPYYRGAATTFWAVYDGNWKLNGATLHHLTSRLDGGDIICHALPTEDDVENGFEFTMKTVKAAHDALIEILSNGDVWRWVWRPQDITLQLRHCKKKDFTDEVAEEWLRRHYTSKEISVNLQAATVDPPGLVRPFRF